jgi:hypothetical protein
MNFLDGPRYDDWSALGRNDILTAIETRRATNQDSTGRTGVKGVEIGTSGGDMLGGVVS